MQHVSSYLVASCLLAIAVGCSNGAEDGAVGPSDSTPSAASASPEPTEAPLAATEEPRSGVLDELLDLAAGFEEVAVWGRDPAGVSFEAPNGLTIDSEGFVWGLYTRVDSGGSPAGC